MIAPYARLTTIIYGARMPSLNRSRSSLVAGIVFLVIWGLTTHGKYSVTGDEPHYLIVAESLWSDGDLDLADEYRSGASRLFGQDDLEIGGHARPDLTGTLRPVHDIGLPLLLLPFYGPAVALSQSIPGEWLQALKQPPGLFAYSLMSLSMLVLVCLSLSALMKTLTPPMSEVAAGTVVLAIALSPPVLSNAFLLFPEGVAFAVVCATLYVTYSARHIRFTHVALVSGALGALPWFHRKFFPFAVGLLFVLIVGRKDVFRQLSATRIGLVAFLFFGPQLALAAWSHHHWGHLGGPLTLDGYPFSWDAFRAGAFGFLIDRENGLLVWAPLYLVLPAAWWIARPVSRALLVPSVLLVLPAAAHDQWWGGFSPAGRFLVPLIPFFALVIARSLRHRVFAVTWCALLVPQFLVSAYGWQHTRQLWPEGTGENPILLALPWIGPRISGLLPSLRGASPEVGSATLWILAVALVNVALVTAIRTPSLPGSSTTQAQHERSRPRDVVGQD